MDFDFSKDEDWKKYCQARCAELHPDVFGENRKHESALVFFKYAKILHDVFSLGQDYSAHPSNPWSDNYYKKNLDNDTKLVNTQPMDNEQAELIKFLSERIQELHPRVFTQGEPAMTDRMTFFAYNQFLFRKFNIGQDLQGNPKNPWKNCEPPMDFTGHGQIRQIPEHIRPQSEAKLENAKTQVIPTLPAIGGAAANAPIGVQPLPPAPQELWRVFDVDEPLRTVYQGTEGDAFQYMTKANKDAGYTAFGNEKTGTRFVPKTRREPRIVKSGVTIYESQGCGSDRCQVRTPVVYHKTAKMRVAEYLKAQQQAEAKKD